MVVLTIGYASFSFFSQKEVVSHIKSEQAAKLVNINTASQAELEGLKGIGPVLSQRIINGRPYNNIDDILKVKGLGPKKFAKMKDIITVK